MAQSEFIQLDGVKTHNLKNLDVRIPIGEMTVVTGVSGSGKSSLVFDTLYSEAYRRYVESLSSFARQYLKAMPKPPVAAVRNLPPAIAVKQGRSTGTSRSTVGTLTELNDLVRNVFAHLSQVVCHNCKTPVVKDSPESLATTIAGDLAGQKAFICAPLAHYKGVKGIKGSDLKEQLLGQGFTRALVGAAKDVKTGIVRLEDVGVTKVMDARLVVDRIEVSAANFRRLAEALEIAFRVGQGKCSVVSEAGREVNGSTSLDCTTCGTMYAEPSPALLSFNHPLGACLRCQGFGLMSEINWIKVTPDLSESLSTEGVAPWNFGDHGDHRYNDALRSAKREGVDPKKPFAKYTKPEWDWLKNGDGKDFEGVVGYFAWLDEKKYKPHYRMHAARFRHYVMCEDCKGARLRPASLACRIETHNISDVCNFMLKQLPAWFDRVEELARQKDVEQDANGQGLRGLSETFEEVRARVGYLLKIGVGYLSLSRTSRTLSGGELQRINMARSLGSALTETLFCLDEPTCGLHPRDSTNLLDVMKEMRDQGNTVVVVEHERLVVSGADHLIEIGPRAGHEGGEIVFDGSATKWVSQQESLWRASDGSKLRKGYIELKGGKTHNLKGVGARFPIGAMTAVCGVSGSGKTSLVQHTLYPLLQDLLKGEDERETAGDVEGQVVDNAALRAHGNVLLISQTSLGRSSRSNIATYLGFFDDVRKLLSGTPQAQKLGLKPGAFSFNTPGGRCENCRGLGVVTEDLSFLGEMDVICPVCNGKRFSEAVLSVTFRGKNLLDILAMTVDEARTFFLSHAGVIRTLDAVIKMGLGYVTLGQHTSSFSGGEAQRLKLTGLMREAAVDKPSILIFDEPTTGLSDKDVANFIEQLRFLTDRGHTLILVEHHVGVLRSADWLVEVGPEAGDLGGAIVYEGVPDGIKTVKGSRSAPFLQ